MWKVEQRAVNVQVGGRIRIQRVAPGWLEDVVHPGLGQVATNHAWGQRRRGHATVGGVPAGKAASGGNHVVTAGDAIGQERLDHVLGVRARVLQIEVVVPFRGQVAADAADGTVEVDVLLAVVRAEADEGTDCHNLPVGGTVSGRVQGGQVAELRRQQQAAARIVHRKLAVTGLAGFATAAQQFEVQLRVAQRTNVNATLQEASEVVGWRDQRLF